MRQTHKARGAKGEAWPGYLVKMAEINSQQEKPICPNRKN